MVVVSSTSRLKTGVLACEGEVGGEVEGDLLLEWIIDLGLLTIHSLALLLALKILMPRKSMQQHRGKPPRPDLKSNSFFICVPTGYNGTNFPMIYKWDG